MTNATVKQVRKHYTDQGYQVHISKNGRVVFRVPLADALWKDGRWISEYRVVDDQVVQK